MMNIKKIWNWQRFDMGQSKSGALKRLLGALFLGHQTKLAYFSAMPDDSITSVLEVETT